MAFARVVQSQNMSFTSDPGDDVTDVTWETRCVTAPHSCIWWSFADDSSFRTLVSTGLKECGGIYFIFVGVVSVLAVLLRRECWSLKGGRVLWKGSCSDHVLVWHVRRLLGYRSVQRSSWCECNRDVSVCIIYKHVRHHKRQSDYPVAVWWKTDWPVSFIFFSVEALGAKWSLLSCTSEKALGSQTTCPPHILKLTSRNLLLRRPKVQWRDIAGSRFHNRRVKRW